jgi:hypothetical protein
MSPAADRPLAGFRGVDYEMHRAIHSLIVTRPAGHPRSGICTRSRCSGAPFSSVPQDRRSLRATGAVHETRC